MIILLKVILLLILQFKYSSAIASCVPCICLRSYGARKADCSRKIVNFTMNNIPDFISSDIQILNMTQHNLVTLKNETFVKVNLTELSSLYLDRCNIKNIEKEAFKDLTYLTDLSLMYNDLHELEPGLFDTNIFLKYLWIENNKIKHLPNGLFNMLENFQGLFARFNEISFVDGNLFINNKYLWIIDLSNNKLNYLNSQLIKKSNISIIFMQENPFICDCQLKDLHEIMKIRNLYNKTQPMCSFPNRLDGKEISLLKSSDFKCWLDTKILPNEGRKIYDNTNLTIQCISNGLPKPETKLIHNDEIIEPVYYFQEDTKYFYNFSITNLTVNDSGLYKCVSKNKIYNSSSPNIDITVIKTEKPYIKIDKPSVLTFMTEIYNFTLSCQYTGIPKPSAYWKYNNTEITSSSFNIIKYSAQNSDTQWINLTINVLNYNNKGNYSCNAQNDLQSVEQTIQIDVRPPFLPQITIFGEESKEETGNLTLSCFIQTYSKPIISWKLNNNTLTLNNYLITTKLYNNQSAWYNLTIYNVTMENTGIYECVASTKEANKSAPHYVHILKKHLELTMDAIRENLNIKIWCQINGYPKPVIEWIYKNETHTVTIKNNTDKYSIKASKITIERYWSNLTIFNVTYNENGMYYCVANNTEQSIDKYINLNFFQKANYLYWYVASVIIIVFILVTIFIKIYVKCKNVTEEKQKSKSDSNTSDSKVIFVLLDFCKVFISDVFYTFLDNDSNSNDTHERIF